MEISVEQYPWAYPESSVAVSRGEEGVLGRGAYGEVRRAVWCGIPVACKRLHNFSRDSSPQTQAMLVAEMSLLATLRHPNLVLFLGVCYDDTTKTPTSILTEMLPYSLYDLLEVHEIRLEVVEVLDIAMDIAQALKYLHSHEPAIVHRDLSSKNVLMGYGRAKLSDLGQAKMLTDVNSNAHANTTMPGAMAYSAPEVLTGIYDKSIDVFSFAVLVVQLVTGEFPRIDRRRAQLQAAASRCPFFSALIERCLQLYPQDRPAITDVVVFLKDIMENGRVYNDQDNQSGDVGILAKRAMRHTMDDHAKELRQQLALIQKRLLASEERQKHEMLRADRNVEELQRSQQSEAQLQQQNRELRQQVTALEEQLHQAIVSRQQAVEAHAESVETISSLERRLTDLSQSMASSNQQCEILKQQNHEWQQRIQCLDSEKSDFEHAHSQALHGAEEVRAQLNLQLEATRELDLRLTQTLHRWQAEQLSRSSVEKSLRDAHRTIHSLRSEKEELSDKVTLLKQQIQHHAVDSQQRATEETGARLEVQDLHRRNAQLERTIERLRVEAQEQLNNLETARSLLAHESMEKQALESQQMTVKRQLNELSDQVKHLRKHLSMTEDHANKLQSQRDQLQQQLSAMQVVANLPQQMPRQSQVVVGNSETVGATTLEHVAAPPTTTSTAPPSVLSNAAQSSSLTLDTDRAVKSRVYDAIQQGPQALLDLMQHNMTDVRLAWRCIRYIKSFAQEDLQHREQLADLGVFTIMITALRAHHGVRDLQLEGLKAVAAAVYKSNRCRRLAGEASIPQYACQMLQEFAADADIIAQACTTLTNLAHSSFENKDRIVEARGVDYLMAAMQNFAGDPKVQTQAAWMLLTLAASDTISVELARLGGAASLINAISNHRTNEQVVYYATWALNNLAACRDPRVKDALVGAGIGEACSIVLELFPSVSDITQFVQGISKKLHM